jgi:hypothetical protein
MERRTGAKQKKREKTRPSSALSDLLSINERRVKDWRQADIPASLIQSH